MSTTNQGRPCMAQGRIVWVSGDLFKGRPKVDQNTKLPIIDQKTGHQKIEYGFGLAIPKNLCQDVWNALHQEAVSIYPSGHVPPGFAMKFKDGDSIDDKGQPFANREGYAGCIVLACTTSLPIKYYRWENNQNFQINEGIKCGDYVNVQLNIKAHPANGSQKAGLYVNPGAVQFLGFGKEIVNTPSGDQIFGTTAPPLPQGASAAPVAPAGFIAPTQGFPSPAQAPAGFAPQAPQTPGYAQPAVPAPSAPVQPNYGVLPPIHQPQQGPPAMPGFPQQAAPQQGFPQMGNGFPMPASPAAPPQSYPTMPQGQPGFAPPAQQSTFPGNQGFPQQSPGWPPMPR